MGWVGLRGAVPIILATYPVLAHADGAQRIFNVDFSVVQMNTLLTGSAVRWMTLLVQARIRRASAAARGDAGGHFHRETDRRLR